MLTGKDVKKVLLNTIQVTPKLLTNDTQLSQTLDTVFNQNQTSDETKLYDKVRVAFDLKKYDENLSALITFLDIINDLKHSSNFTNEQFSFLCLYNQEPIYTNRQLKALNVLNNKVKKYFDQELVFPIQQNTTIKNIIFNSDAGWNLAQVASLNQGINSVCDTLNNSGLSVYEKYLGIYAYASKYSYTKENEKDHDSVSRRLIPALENKKHVCVFYAELVKILCTNCGIPCTTVTANMSTTDTNHIFNLVKIVDDKYNINQLIAGDASSDAYKLSDPASVKRFNYHFLPLKEFVDAEVMTSIDNLKNSSIYLNLVGKTSTFEPLKNANQLHDFLLDLQTNSFFDNQVHNILIDNKKHSKFAEQKNIELYSAIKQQILQAQVVDKEVFTQALQTLYYKTNFTHYAPITEPTNNSSYDFYSLQHINRLVQKTVAFNENIASQEMSSYNHKTTFSNPITTCGTTSSLIR